MLNLLLNYRLPTILINLLFLLVLRRLQFDTACDWRLDATRIVVNIPEHAVSGAIALLWALLLDLVNCIN